MRTHIPSLVARTLAPLFLFLPVAVGCGDDASSRTDDHGHDTDPSEGTTESPTTTELGTETTSEPTDDGSTTATTDTNDDTETGANESASADTGAEMLEIIGEWIEAFPGGMTTHTITAESWTQSADFGTFGYTLEVFDNAERWVVGEDDDNGGYSRFDWTWDRRALYYCTSAFGLATVQEAIDAPAADATNLETGCGGFSWSHLEPA